MRVVVEISSPIAPTGIRRFRVETLLRRDGDRLEVSGREVFEGKKFERMSHNFRRVYTNEVRVASAWGLSEQGPIKTGSSFTKQRRLDDLAGYVCAGPLEGYLPNVRPVGRIAEVLQLADDLRVSRGEVIAGTPCKKVEGRLAYGRITLWLAESKGCLPLKILHEMEPGDTIPVFEDGKELEKPMGQVQLPRPDRASESYTFSRQTYALDQVTIDQVGEAYIASGGRFTATSRTSYGWVGERLEKYTRSEIDLAPQLGPDVFAINLPEGALLSNDDESQAGVMYEWRGGKIVPAQGNFSGTAEGSWGSRSLWITAFWIVLALAFGVAVTWWAWRRRHAA
jgi:hypothetical protein